MANPEHVNWLLEEGVEAWNRRRIERPFTPRLEYADLRELNLSNVDLEQADLQGADLRKTNLRGSYLIGANLEAAHLKGADLREADLTRVNLKSAILRGVNIRSILSTEATTIRGSASRMDGRTDVSPVQNLNQIQLNSMQGDTGVLLPKGLQHPVWWPVWDEDPEVATASEDAERVSDSHTTKLHRLVTHHSPITGRSVEGRFDVVDGPPGGRPLANNPSDQQSLFQGIETGCELFLKRFDIRDHNIPADVSEGFEIARAFAVERCEHWYKWEHALAVIEDDLDKFADAGWGGTRKSAETIAGQIRALAKYLQLTLPAEEADEVELVHVGEYNNTRTEALSAAIEEITNVPGADGVLTEDTIKHINGKVSELKNIATDLELTPTGEQAEKKKNHWKTVVFGLAGLIAAGIVTLPMDIAKAVATKVLTSKDAGPMVLEKFNQAWELIKNLLTLVG